MKGKMKKFIILIVSILSIFLGSMNLYYPDTEEMKTEFSSENVKEDLEVITKEPHSTMFHQEELGKVRSYLTNKLEEFNMNTQVFEYKNVTNTKGETADLHNIYYS